MLRAFVLVTWAVLFGAACRVLEDRPEPVPSESGTALALTVIAPAEDIQLPIADHQPSSAIALGPWSQARADRKEWSALKSPLPIRPRVFFFSRPVVGMSVIGPNGEIPHKRDAKQSDAYWTWSKTSITIHWNKTKTLSPQHNEYTLKYDRAITREQAMFFSGQDTANARAFVQTKKQLGTQTHTGLYLPAPGFIRFDIVVPEAAELTFDAGILPPEVQRKQRSDGATLTLQIHAGDESVTLDTLSLKVGTLVPHRFNLSRWAGQSISLAFNTTPGASNDADFCFIANPTISSRLSQPKRVFWIFVDTLRPDHLGIYGYHRNTSPFIDSWAKTGTTFTQARSIAPWTLPSYRAMVTGRYPNRWASSKTLQQHLREQGWQTAMFAGNVYLSSNFEGDRGWGMHDALLDATATRQVNVVRTWLDKHEDKNVFAMIHLMDPHLPYQEPSAYRRLFTAADEPDTLPERFARGTVLRAKTLGRDGRQHVRNRYDNNIRYVDDELKRLFASFTDDDLIFFFSDHGEEFWEHGGFEHGHEFWDEIVRVPMIVTGPDVRVQRVDEPVTLLDLTPTLLDYIDGSSLNTHGQSLRPLLTGDGPWTPRSSGLGHPLYGGERWGVVHEGHKFSHYNGKERLFDLQADPKEQNNILPADLSTDHPWHVAVSDAFKQPFPGALRFKNRHSRRHPDEALQVDLIVPGGIQNIWVGEDPLQSSKASVARTPTGAVLSWPGGYKGSRDVYVVPNEPMEQSVATIQLRARIGDREWTPFSLRQGQLESRTILFSETLDGGGQLKVTVGRAPVPTDETQEVVGHDDEMQEMLKALGYVTGNE